MDTSGIFYWQFLSKLISQPQKQNVHILTLTHTKNLVTKYIGLTCVHTLYLDTRKHIFHPFCCNAPLTTSMLQLCVHYLSCLNYNQGSAYKYSDHLYKAIAASITNIWQPTYFIWNLLNNFEVSHNKLCKNTGWNIPQPTRYWYKNMWKMRCIYIWLRIEKTDKYIFPKNRT